MSRFDDKVVLVTGGGSGIGLATACAFAREGAKVVICSRSEKGQQASTQIRQEGGDALFVQCDVASHTAQLSLIEKILSTYGRLDIAVNNAGVEGPLVPLEQIELESWREVIDINLTGVWLGMKEQIKIMKNSGGVIVNISSIAGMKTLQNVGAYAASKAAVISLTKTAAVECASSGIRINAVCPGPVLTAMVKNFQEHDPEFFRETILDSIPMKRIGMSEEIAKGILWLTSDDASFMTGQCLVLDGGLCA